MSTQALNAIYDKNLEYIRELQKRCNWAAKTWMDHCWSEGIYFAITEAYRTQERQNQLYKIGRRGVKGEVPVTWTLNSLHTQRLAVDLVPLNGYGDRDAYAKIEKLAALYGITHPLPGDFPHFEFGNARQPVIPPIPPPEVLLKKLQNALRWANEARRRMILRAIERLQKILGRDAREDR